jgi:hypothetical protein
MKINTTPSTANTQDLLLNPPSRTCERPRSRRRQINRSRAAYWFAQMRKAVDAACDWKPAPAPRPVQMHITLESNR